MSGYVFSHQTKFSEYKRVRIHTCSVSVNHVGQVTDCCVCLILDANVPLQIQVIEDDRRNRGGVFQTNSRGQVPPLVTTDFHTEDAGNANPRFIRSTMYNLPCTQDMQKECHIPIAMTITPFARLDEKEVRLLTFRQLSCPKRLVDFRLLFVYTETALPYDSALRGARIVLTIL